MTRAFASLVALTALVGSLFLLTAREASADTLVSYTRQSSNAATDVAGQLGTTVSFSTVGGDTFAHFRFFNDVGTPSTLADIYFRETLDTVLDFDSASISSSGGVSFSAGARPRAVPGAFGWGNRRHIAFSLDADVPIRRHGLTHAHDWVEVSVEALGTEESVLAALDTTALGASSLGLHVQRIGGDSDWFYNSSTTTAPEPTSILLVGAALVGVAERRRRSLGTRAS